METEDYLDIMKRLNLTILSYIDGDYLILSSDYNNAVSYTKKFSLWELKNLAFRLDINESFVFSFYRYLVEELGFTL